MQVKHNNRMFNYLGVMAVIGLVAGIPSALRGASLNPPNSKPVAVLGQLDIDGDGLPDGAVDSDGDGLPDNWEKEPGTLDKRIVYFPSPTAISPGTPPTVIWSRNPVATDSDNFDTDGDGLTDFIEVFGLKFIDDNHNGRLDCYFYKNKDASNQGQEVGNAAEVREDLRGLSPDEAKKWFVGRYWFADSNGNGKWDPNISAESLHEVRQAGDLEGVGSEWYDANGDGMPSVGEYPLPDLYHCEPFTDTNGNGVWDPGEPFVDQNGNGRWDSNDFDGFVFTDPTNPDTDGDGTLDGADNNPLVNPNMFGGDRGNFDQDKDNDGLGNGSDFGNDLLQKVDNPPDLLTLLNLFRKDLLGPPPIIPEAALEDVTGSDWNGDGLFRTTDVKEWNILTTSLDNQTAYPEFYVGGFKLFNSFVPTNSTQVPTPRYGPEGLGLGFQTILRPADRTTQPLFMPDVHIWAILYAWRVPGFDVDGDGFVGVPSTARGYTAPSANNSSLAAVVLDNSKDPPQPALDQSFVGKLAFDDRLEIETKTTPTYNGKIELTGCPFLGATGLAAVLAGFLALLPWSRRE